MFHCFHRFHHNRRGSSMIFVLALLAVFSITAVALTTASVASFQSDSTQQTTRQAYFSARSAARAVAAYIQNNSGWVDGNISATGASVNASVRASDVMPGSNTANAANAVVKRVAADQITVTGKATYQGKTSTAVLYLKKAGGGSPTTPPLFDNLFYLTGGAYGDSNYTLSQSNYYGLSGNSLPTISSNAEISVPDGTMVEGNLYSSKRITLRAGSKIAGDVSTQANLEVYNSATVNGNVVVNGDLISSGGTGLNVTPLSGETLSVQVGGNVNLSSGGNIQGKVITNGSFTASGGVTVSGNISAQGAVSLSSGTYSGNIVTGSDLSLNGSASVSGSADVGGASNLTSGSIGSYLKSIGNVFLNWGTSIRGYLRTCGAISVPSYAAISSFVSDYKDGSNGVTASNIGLATPSAAASASFTPKTTNDVSIPSDVTFPTVYDEAYFNSQSGQHRITDNGVLKSINGSDGTNVHNVWTTISPIVISAGDANKDIYLKIEDNVNLENVQILIDTANTRNVYLCISGSNVGLSLNGNVDIGRSYASYLAGQADTSSPRLFITGTGETGQGVYYNNGANTIHAYIYMPKGTLQLKGTGYGVETFSASQLSGASGDKQMTLVGSAVVAHYSVTNNINCLYVPLSSAASLPDWLESATSSSGGSSGSAAGTWSVDKWGAS